MRVYSKVTLDLTTLEVVEAEYEEYSGPVEECKGGGGASGKVDFPEYIKTAHGRWLDHNGSDYPTSSVTDLVNVGLISGSPWAGETVPDQTSNLTEMDVAVADMDALQTQLLSASAIDDAAQNMLSQDRIDASVTAFSNLLQDELDSTVIPQFEAGMRDINAVLSSAFVIGKAIIQDGKDKKVAQYAGDLAAKIQTDLALQAVGMRLEYARAASTLAIETARYKYNIESEVHHQNLEYEAADKKWGLGLYEQAGNVMAAPSGASAAKKDGPTKIQSATAGALTGGVAGAMYGAQAGGLTGPQGAVVGALVGGVAGYLLA